MLEPVRENSARAAGLLSIAARFHRRCGKRDSGSRPTWAHTASPDRRESPLQTLLPREDMAAEWAKRVLETNAPGLRRELRQQQCRRFLQRLFGGVWQLPFINFRCVPCDG